VKLTPAYESVRGFRWPSAGKCTAHSCFTTTAGGKVAEANTIVDPKRLLGLKLAVLTPDEANTGSRAEVCRFC
jgi:hypothetical protein